MLINMKKQFFDFMGTLFKTSIYVVCCLSLIGLSSCSVDDDDEGGKPTTGLVSTTIPSAGWSGSTTNGICTYRSDYTDDEFSCYYAFAFENGKCTDAVFNVVCENETMAKYLSQMLNSGEWAEDNDEDYSRSLLENERNPILTQALSYSKAIKSAAKNTRAANVMGITCTQEGKVVYFKVDAVKGLDGEDVKYVVKTWDTGLDINTLPAQPIFGTWDEVTGKYTSNCIYGIPDTKVEIEIAFNSSDILTKYIATFTLPNTLWAEMVEESLREQAEGLKELAGIELEITRNGNIVSANTRNVETMETEKNYVIKMIVAIDILYARPIGTAIF